MHLINHIFNILWTHKFNSKHALSSHLHAHFTASSHSESVITVMSFSSADIMLLSENTCSAVTQSEKLHLKSNTSLQLEMRMLMIKLDDLLLLENAELYCSNWKKLKIKIMQLTAECTVNVDNQHIKKLTWTVEALMINQKKLTSAVLIIYMTALKSMSVWSDLLTVCEISTCLVRKLMIVCSDVFSQD